MLLIKNVRVIFENGISDCEVLLDGGKIVETGNAVCCPDAETVDGNGCYLSAGLIDLHVHGGGGFSAMGSADDVLKAAEAHLKYGVTSILPTALAAPLETLSGVIENIREAQRKNPNILGAHLEGPFLSPDMCGAQNTDCLGIPSQTDYRAFFERYADTVKLVGVAPELDGAYELEEYLNKKGITVSVAHSAGDYGTAKEALLHGFSDITHIFNACTSCSKDGAFRKGGTVEAGLTLDGYTVQAIADLKHLPAELLELVFRCKGKNGMYLISDGLEFSACEIADGETVTQRNGVKAVFHGGAMMTEDGKRLAGGASSGIKLVKNVFDSTSADLVQAVGMMTLTPARVIGVDSHKGRIAAGCDADLILFDGGFNIKGVIRNGFRII